MGEECRSRRQRLSCLRLYTTFTIVGLPETGVKESKDRVRAALRTGHFEFPARRMVNLAPADLPEESGGFRRYPAGSLEGLRIRRRIRTDRGAAFCARVAGHDLQGKSRRLRLHSAQQCQRSCVGAGSWHLCGGQPARGLCASLQAGIAC